MKSDNFTILRHVMAVLVVFSHSYPLLGLPEPHLLGVTVGTFAVQCFFVISGYLIVGSYLTTGRPLLFAYKRFARLVPALVVAVPGSLVLFHFQDGFAGNPIQGIPNGSLWTISWEVLMYALTLLLGITGLLTPSVMGSAFVAGAVLLFVSISPASPATDLVAPLVLLFAAGGMIKVTETRFDLTTCGVMACIVLLIGLLPFTDAVLAWMPGHNMIFHNGPSIPWQAASNFAYMLALPFALLFVASRFPASIPMRSDYSYGIYIWAWPIQETLVYQAAQHQFALEPRLLFIATAALSFGCAFVSWHLIEKNAIRLSHRYSSAASRKKSSIAADDMPNTVPTASVIQ